MRGYMFRNRWGALFFVGLTLAGVTTLVGTDKEDGALQQATDQIALQKAQADQLMAGPGAMMETGTPSAAAVLVPEEELIDQALGEDPTPIDEFATAHPDEDVPADGDTVIIVSRDGAGGQTPVATLPQQ